jgi:hypothetical protein
MGRITRICTPSGQVATHVRNRSRGSQHPLALAQHHQQSTARPAPARKHRSRRLEKLELAAAGERPKALRFRSQHPKPKYPPVTRSERYCSRTSQNGFLHAHGFKLGHSASGHACSLTAKTTNCAFATTRLFWARVLSIPAIHRLSLIENFPRIACNY